MKIDIKQIKPNPKNPRVIKDANFDKLKRSIQEFPEMLEKRPLVCYTDTDGKLVVLGGNMRLKAAKDLGIQELPVILADDWTAEQKEQFIIRDNVSGGEWDWEALTDWEKSELAEWGVDVPSFGVALDADEFGDEFSLPEGDKAPFQQMTFTLADEQAEQIKNAIADIKQTEEYKYAETMGNENSNGNALYLIVMQWAEQRK
jgi:hypothetical protein